MKINRLNGLVLGALLACSAPAWADSSGTGTDYLMTRTTLYPSQPAKGARPTGSAKNRSLVQSLPSNSSSTTANRPANTQEFPPQILRTGVSLSASGLSANSLQLCDSIGLSPLLERITALRSQLPEIETDKTIQGLSRKQDLLDATQSARLIVQKASLEIDFTVAEIEAERQVYHELLSTFKNDRDKALAITNACAFISNGVLWAVTEALVIPAYKYPVYNVPVGIVGIPAGVIPSIASLYTFKQINGKKKTSEVEPNMLAKVFNYPTNPEIEYPGSVWTYLNQVPADAPGSKKRLEQIVDRWIADSNMPAFTDKNSKKQLDVLTASVAQRKGLTIATLTSRSVMLDQLLVEVNKMKRMLLELDMVAIGDKRFIANSSRINSI
jgi:hypothetical protein